MVVEEFKEPSNSRTQPSQKSTVKNRQEKMQRSPLIEDRNNNMPEKSEVTYNSNITERIRRASIIRSDTLEEGKQAQIEYDRVSEV